MRRLFAVLVPLVAVVVIAAPASAATTRETIPFSDTITDCGNTIQISGQVAATFIETATPSGGFVVASNFVPRRIIGSDELGRLYIGTGLTRDITIFSPPGGLTETFINRFHVVGTMGAPTFYIKETFHVTVTASGDVRAFIDNFSSQCV